MQDNFYSAKDKIIDVVSFISSIGYVYMPQWENKNSYLQNNVPVNNWYE